jgi:hypothetical protein
LFLEVEMLDLLSIVFLIVFFALSFLLIKGLERIKE